MMTLLGKYGVNQKSDSASPVSLCTKINKYIILLALKEQGNETRLVMSFSRCSSETRRHNFTCLCYHSYYHYTVFIFIFCCNSQVSTKKNVRYFVCIQVKFFGDFFLPISHCDRSCEDIVKSIITKERSIKTKLKTVFVVGKAEAVHFFRETT